MNQKGGMHSREQVFSLAEKRTDCVQQRTFYYAFECQLKRPVMYILTWYLLFLADPSLLYFSFFGARDSTKSEQILTQVARFLSDSRPSGDT